MKMHPRNLTASTRQTAVKYVGLLDPFVTNVPCPEHILNMARFQGKDKYI